MDVLKIIVRCQEAQSVASAHETRVMLPFAGSCEGPLFTGAILPGGVDTQCVCPDGRTHLSARYMLEGRDHTGAACRIFIENLATLGANLPAITHPTLRTDSEALRFLETTPLLGRIEFAPDHLVITISTEEAPHVTPLALKRGGLTLRGRLEKKITGPAPLVLMLHGFTGDMGGPGSWFQRLSDDLTDAGFATLRFDFNGHGQSDGPFQGMTVYNEVEDAAVFLEYAMAREDVTDIYVLGHSQGGVVTGMLAGWYPDVIQRIALLAPAASLITDAQKGECMNARYDPTHIPHEVLVGTHPMGGLYFRMAQNLPLYEQLARFPGEALVVYPGQDVVVDHAMMVRCAKTLPKGRLLEKPTLDHGLGGAEHEETMKDIVAFFCE